MSPVRVGTFNLLHGLSPADGRADPAVLARAAAGLDADLLGLQEVDRLLDRSGTVDQAATVAAALGATAWRFVPALQGAPGAPGCAPVRPGQDPAGAVGCYGIALVSRFPVRCWLVRRFAAAPVTLPLRHPTGRGVVATVDEPRLALAALVDTPDGPLTVVTAHLSFVPGWNVAQLRALVRWAARLPPPRLLLGDLNLPGPLPGWLTGWRPLARAPTYPAPRPRVQWDHVLARGLDPTAVRGVHTPALPLSDHRPLLVDLGGRRPAGADHG